ncbi:hypothetical protein P245_20920 [Comamonas thiooxydans]|uniref:Uncharacterized protein n=1 Tax=Comamonas thiooxydans TaxID=363952 RepID=A0A0E3BAP5_9BURK|nr:hypothetical protein [Comamonas thiooxydans]KGG86183.1 hypothetical protein P245_20920 [Comamonas thiooxydans]
MPSIEELRETRKRAAGKLFLVRCCLAWLPIAMLHLYEQKPIGLGALALYVIGIPAGLAIYDRFILKR